MSTKWLQKLAKSLKLAPGNGPLAEVPVPSDVSAQSKNEQERAIAARIRTAGFVKIEEEYDHAADGIVGLQGGQGNVQVGIKGTNRRLAKRSITFIG